MARQEELPDFYEKRKILFGKRTSDQKMRETGKKFMEAERYDDALEFFARTEAPELVRQIVRTALEAGDTPLLLRAKRVLREGVDEEEWNTLVQNALEAGCPSKAYVALRKAGREKEAEELKERTGIVGQEEPEEPEAEGDVRMA